MRRKYKSIALKKELANDSGKKKCHAMKAQAIVTSQGRIVSLDITVNYCHDMKLFKMSCRNIGQAGKILADSGYQGLMKIYPQAQIPRKSSKLKPLIAEDKTYNHALSKERSKVENIFAKVKTFKMISTTYRNHRKRFGLRMNLIAEKVSKTLNKTFDKDVREIPTSQFYQKFVDEMGRTYSGNLILQELITVNGAYKATYIGELSSN
ncbi:transposase-like protein, IS1381 ISSpn7 [Streptococcus pneumoniae]|nr:transposase-like protein, IS1381 ISSpn7 [Streptococcus pneumoniae]